MTGWFRRHRLVSAGAAALALAALGMGGVVLAISLISSIAIFQGQINTGIVQMDIVQSFTDDDDKVDDPARDANDTGLCEDVGGVAPAGATTTSCDPAASGPDPKSRYDVDVARCDASHTGTAGGVPAQGQIIKTNVYFSYFCTAWFLLKNTGTIPVRITDVQICDANQNCKSVVPSQVTPIDLDGDGVPDVELHITEIELCQRINPGQTQFMDVDEHVILKSTPTAGSSLSERVKVVFAAFNQPCPPPGGPG